MLTALIAVGVFALSPQEPQAPAEGASKIIEKMLARYSAAKSISGTVTLRQRALNTEVRIDTEMQFDRPDKIFIRQTKQANPQSGPQVWVLTSNGKTFTYTKPPGVFSKKPAITEAVNQNGMALKVDDMYMPLKAGLEDPNAMIEIALGRREHLQAILTRWSTMQVYGKVKLGETEATAITGDFRDTLGGPVSGSYEAYIGKDYDFVRYVLKQRFGVPNRPNETIDVTSIWDSTLKVDAQTNPALYKG